MWFVANHSFYQILRLLMHSIVVHVCWCIEHPQLLSLVLVDSYFPVCVYCFRVLLKHTASVKLEVKLASASSVLACRAQFRHQRTRHRAQSRDLYSKNFSCTGSIYYNITGSQPQPSICNITPWLTPHSN